MRDNITSLKEVFHVEDVTSDAMKEAIKDWRDLYYGTPYEGEDDNQRLAFTIVRKLTKNVFAEYEAKGKSDYETAVLEALARVRKKATQLMFIGGEILLKPLIFGDRLDYMAVPRDSIVVSGRNEKNEIIDACFEERSEEGGKYYTLCEHRKVVNKRLHIETKLYQSDNKVYYGKEIPLSSFEKYADVAPQIDIPIDNIGLIPYTCPVENCVDGSDDAVSVYAAATRLIHAINVNEAQINGEFERGQSRIVVSNDYLKADKRGNKNLVDNVFVGVDDDPETVGFQIFSPQLREKSFLARKTEYLRNIESIIGLKRGLLSDVEAEDKTATEITSSAGDYNLTIIDFQEAWEDTVKKALEITAQLYGVYKLGNVQYKEDNISIGWGNGVLYDENKTQADMLAMVEMGMLKPEIYVAWYYNMDFTDDKALAEVREKYMPALEQMAEGE